MKEYVILFSHSVSRLVPVNFAHRLVQVTKTINACLCVWGGGGGGGGGGGVCKTG